MLRFGFEEDAFLARVEEAEGGMRVVAKHGATAIVRSREGAARIAPAVCDLRFRFGGIGGRNGWDRGTNGHGDLLMKIRTLPTGTETPARIASPEKEF